jgi:hypothetical protein
MTRHKPRTSANSNGPPITADTLSLGVGVGIGVATGVGVVEDDGLTKGVGVGVGVGLATGVGVGVDIGLATGVGGGGQSLSLRQKISTMFENPLLRLYPPPKNILLVDEVAAR